MQLPPIAEILSWPQGNYTNPSQVRGPSMIIMTLVFIPLMTILVGARVYTRLRLTRNFGADDVAIVAALVPTMACAVITMDAALYHGWDRHVWDVPTDDLELALKLGLAVEMLFSLACSLTRLSILLLIARIMASGSTVLRRIAISMMVLVGIEELIFVIVTINTCSPVSDYWTLSIAPQKCINEAAHILAAGIINTVNDIIVVSIPIPIVLKLSLPLRQRVVCAMLFGTGFIVCFAAGFRISYMYQLNTSADKTWLAYPTWICGTVELYLGIIATSIPTIKPLVTRYFPNILGHNFTKYGHTGNGPPQSLHTYHSAPQGAHPHRLSQPFSVAHSMSRPLTPIVSTFSTYSRDEKQPAPPTVSERQGSHPMPIRPGTRGAEHTANSSVSSLDMSLSWEGPPQQSATAEPARHIASQEILVRIYSRGKDDLV